MNKTKLDYWIEKTEALPELTREGLEALQLKKLNETLVRLKRRGGIYADYPEALDSLAQLETLPFTTAEMLSANPGKFLLTSQSEVSRVISGPPPVLPGLQNGCFTQPMIRSIRWGSSLPVFRKCCRRGRSAS